MSLSQRADGRWIVKYKVNNAWKQKAFNNEDEARSFDLAVAPDQDKRLSLGECALVYLRSRTDLHTLTRKRVVWLLADGGPAAFMRNKYAESLNRQDLEMLRENFRIRNVSNATINKAQTLLRAILSFSVEQTLIAINPWRDFKKLKETKYLMKTTLEDLKKLYGFLPEHLQWAVKTAFFLSLRFGKIELFNLEWSAFNWQRNIVTIKQGKSGLIKNVILRNPVYIEEAKARHDEDLQKGIPYVVHYKGRHITSCKTAWKNACIKAGVTMRPYDVRHLSATTMLAGGADLAAVASQLGHASVSTTGAIYAHVTPTGQAHAAGLLPTL